MATHVARLTGVFAAATMVAALTACFPQAAPPAETVVVTVTPTPTPEPTPTTPPPAAAPEPAPAPEPVPNAPAPVYEPGPAYDTGPITGAMGAATFDANGMPIRYTVQEGDSFFDIAQRFEIPQQQLLRMNPQIHDFGEAVYIGDEINLDWTKTGLG
jgi:hypothetical protein